MTRLYIAGAVALALIAGVLWLRHDAVQSERARQEAARAKATIENTEKFNEGADADAGGNWFIRLFPDPAP